VKKIAVWPTLATVMNLICGFSAIAAAGGGNFERAAWLVLAAMVFDAADGRLARLTRTSSQFGAELDSLADVVSFGVAPAYLIHNYSVFLHGATTFPAPRILEGYAWAASGLYVVCAALRLARFNVETGLDAESHRSFKGLPSPAAAGLLVTSVLFLNDDIASTFRHFAAGVLPVMMISSAVLMVTRVRYPHLVNQLDVGERPFSFLVLIIFFATLVALAPQIGLFLVFAFYTASGPIGLAIDQVLEHVAASDSDDSLF
jgi:CDP-diacylglycerol---serine O-phosphatidyltransferase